MIKIKVNPKVKNAIEWGFCIIVAVILALLFRHFVGTPTVVQQPSMYPTLKPNDRLFLNRWIKTVNGEYKRGDIITFEAPTDNGELNDPVAKYQKDLSNGWKKFNYYFLENGKVSYIKRIIGLPGEHVEIKDDKVYINGEELKEDYLQQDVKTTSLGGIFVDLVVPADSFFVLGDNRLHSTDSRVFGCIPKDKIESKVLFRFWPLNKFGGVK